jgi:hypothetical protein
MPFLTSCTRLNNCRVGTAWATAELEFQSVESRAHLTSKSLVANGARCERPETQLHPLGMKETQGALVGAKHLDS